jgi:hypothetical protein
LINGEYKFLSYLNYPVLFWNAEDVFTYSDVLIFKPILICNVILTPFHIDKEIATYIYVTKYHTTFWDVTVCAGKWLMTLTKIVLSSFPFYQVTQHNIPEDLNLLQHQYENCIFHIVMPVDGRVTVLIGLNRTEVHM